MTELDEKINNYNENKKRHSFLEEYEELEMYKLVQEKRFSIYKDNTPDISNAIITIYPEYILKTDVSDNEIINKNYTNLIKSSVLDLLSLYLKG